MAIVAGSVLWGILWNVGLLGAQAAFPTVLVPEQPITHAGALLALIAYSAILSVLAGYVTAMIADQRAVKILAGVQLAIGIAVEISYWELMPAWYHIVFLALVVPATLWGGRLRDTATARSGMSPA